MVQFVKSRGDFDFISPVQNFLSNCALFGGIAVVGSVITAVALKALGYGGAATAIASTLAFTGGAAVVVGVVGGAVLLALFVKVFVDGYKRS